MIRMQVTFNINMFRKTRFIKRKNYYVILIQA